MQKEARADAHGPKMSNFSHVLAHSKGIHSIQFPFPTSKNIVNIFCDQVLPSPIRPIVISIFAQVCDHDIAYRVDADVKLLCAKLGLGNANDQLEEF